MSRPPLFIGLAFGKPGGFRLWFPLFILVPFLLVILLALAPFLLLGALVLWAFGLARPLLLFIPVVLGVLWALRGLEVDINDRGQKVFISIE